MGAPEFVLEKAPPPPPPDDDNGDDGDPGNGNDFSFDEWGE
jgi:hypothetical protein